MSPPGRNQCVADDRGPSAYRPNSPGLGPQVRSGEIDEIVTATVEYGFHHVEGEPLGHFRGNGGRDWKHGPAYPRVDQPRSVIGKCGGGAPPAGSGVLAWDAT